MGERVDDDALVTAAMERLERAAAADAPPERHDEARDAVDALFAAHHQRVYRVCRRFVGDEQLAAELTQDVFVVAWRRLGEFTPDGSFFGWLYHIARFTCMNALRKRREHLDDEGFVDDVDEEPGALTGLHRHERLALLEQAAATVLDDVEREVVYLRYREGLGQEEITRLLELPGASGARGVLVRCRRKLEKELRRRAAELDVKSSFFRVTR